MLGLLADVPRLARLLKHFNRVVDFRESWRVAYPIRDVLLLVVCATIASCDDYDDIVDWGKANLDFLRRIYAFHHGVPCADWLRELMNSLDPDVFADCFGAWVAEEFAGRPGHIAIDGKCSRRTHDRARGRKALHLVSAFATAESLVLAQEAVEEKANELQAIPIVLAQLAEAGQLEGAIVTIDAMGCNPTIAAAILAGGADYVLAVKGNQPTLEGEIDMYFAAAPAAETTTESTLEKNRGRIEERGCVASTKVDWLTGPKHYPGEFRFPKLATIAKIDTRTELKDRCRFDTRYFISSRALDATAMLGFVRDHWGIENSLHWVLDVTFREDQSRLRKGHGARNMAVVRHFALDLVRSAPLQGISIKRRRKRAAYDNRHLAYILGLGFC